MKGAILKLLAVGLLAGSMTANATSMRFTATTTVPTQLSSFYVDFDDDGDGLLEFGEITFFSGVELIGSSDPWLNTLEIVAQTTSSINSSNSPNSGCTVSSEWWCFTNSTNVTSADQNNWTYATRTLGTNPNPVPEPGTLALLSLGLAGLGMSRRRKAN